MATHDTGTSPMMLVRSILLVTVLAVFAPWALMTAARARFGGGLPLHGVPSPAEWESARIRDALRDRLTDDLISDVVIRLALLVLWAALIVVLLTVIAEFAHMVRHKGLPLPDIRGFGLTQRAARVIAAGLLVIVPMLSPARAVARGSYQLVPTQRAPTTMMFDQAAVFLRPAPEQVASSPNEHVVRPGESIFGIAERLAGPNPSDVADYAEQLLDLNLGRHMGNGQRFTNAALIDVGWVLHLPTAAGISEPTRLPGSVHIVESGETLWSIADDELGAGERWPEIFDANADRTFDDGRTLDDPSMIHTGWGLDVPGEPVDVPVVVPVVVPDAAPLVPELDVVAVPRRVPVTIIESSVEAAVEIEPARPDNTWLAKPAESDAGAADLDDVAGVEGASEVPELITSGGAAMLAAGVLTLLTVRRRNQQRRARPRARIPVPTASLAATERSLRSIDPGERLARVDVAIRAASMGLVQHSQRVLAILCAPDGEIELIATGVVELPNPWEGATDRWHLAASIPLELLADEARRTGAPTPTPTLVQLGRTECGRDVYVDLEAIEALEVGGPERYADAIVAAVAATLASSVLAEVTTLIGVGIPADAFLGHRLYVPADDPVQAFAVAAHAIGSTGSTSGSTFELRARVTSGETWEPAVVLIGSTAGVAMPPQSRKGMAIVSASPIHGPSSRLVPDGDAWELKPVGLRMNPIGLTSDDVAVLAELVEIADAELEPAGSEPARPEDSTVSTVSESWDLLVRLLGRVDVISAGGSTAEFERSKTRELIAWLATHRDRPTRSSARTALWELDVRDATFANVVSEARRSLARLVEPPQGEEWVGRTMTESLPLHARVVTDADLVAQALAVARLQPPAQAIETLEAAVAWISGVPFDGTSYLWPDAEGITSNFVLLATSATSELAAHCLSVGDIEGVFRATGRGLSVLPGHEELIGLRMRAHARSGDHAGVRHEWDSYERVITADPWSDGEPSPKLVDLRRQLLNPSR